MNNYLYEDLYSICVGYIYREWSIVLCRLIGSNDLERHRGTKGGLGWLDNAVSTKSLFLPPGLHIAHGEIVPGMPTV